ncbi:recombination protein RecR [Candidatus Desantisbacteria bacterium CG1_02_38_46]|uniref:Recombination protein RecR n=1 Tax=Candidatus Desantisbacteria bacterium CG1_02_38_46 TaxID=1817893 RepID=A0A1J4SF70_9BACT|nr:MAG: recombination protein RecR [Candidatus Desantisbacteria bacterium CG1_02_38_46]
MFYAKALQKLIDELNKLPGIGPKTAQRLALHILRINEKEARSLAQAILEVREKIRSCSVCNNLTEADPCPICQDENRLHSVLCVVEEPDDLVAFERTRQYKGLYHILGGAISPLEGVNPEDLNIDRLLERIKKGKVEEVILATNPNIEGEATALYIARLIKPLGVKVTRLAHGLPVGGDLEFADEITLSMALEGRKEM